MMMMTEEEDEEEEKDQEEEEVPEEEDKVGSGSSNGVPPPPPLLPSSKILIFHPGSKYLRFGRATDPQPLSILHAIARRRKVVPGVNTLRKDGLLPNDCENCWRKLPAAEVESARLQLCHTLQAATRSDGSGRFATHTQTIKDCNNKEVRGEGDRERDEGQNEKGGESPGKRKKWKEFNNGEDMVVGDYISEMNPEANFNTHFPWRRGQLNVHENIGGSLASVVTDLADIWSWCVAEKLGIPLHDLKDYGAVVIIPVMFEKIYARELTNLLLSVMGFSSAFLIQDHVCASFGAGLPTTVVVDVGDQKVSVSVVDDGISIPQSRIFLKYGGIDLTCALWHLMQQQDVPFPVDRHSIWDIEFMNSLKETLCHIDLDKCGPEEHVIVWDKPGQPPVVYNTHFGDELLIVPLSYINPDLLRRSVGANAMQRYDSHDVHVADDVLEDVYLMESLKRAKETDTADEDVADSGKEVQNHENEANRLLSIDQAILQSIEACDIGDDIKRRVDSSVLVVGGGFSFRGLKQWLEQRLNLMIPKIFKTDVNIITRTKDMDPDCISWKGASILCQLDTSSELWISQEEWKKFGFRILREKSLCTF